MSIHMTEHNKERPDTLVLEKQEQWVEVVNRIPALKAIASDLFPGEIRIEVESDPEIPGYRCVVFNVSVPDDQKAIPALRREWYRRTFDLLNENCDKVRLLMSVEQ